MKASKVISGITKGVGVITIIAAAAAAGMIAYASVKVPRSGGRIHA